MVVVAYNKVFTTTSLLPKLNNYPPNNKSSVNSSIISNDYYTNRIRRRSGLTLTWALAAAAAAGDHSNSKKAVASQYSNYVVSFDSSSCITRPLAEILRDLNKRIPDNIIINNNNTSNIKTGAAAAATVENDDDQQDLTAVPADQDDSPSKTYIPWYHANRMLSFYAPGWCGEIRDVIFSDNGSVTVVYRVTIRGSDGEAHRESTGTVSPPMNGHDVDVVAAAEEIAFCRACARFGLGLYLYHDE